MGPTDTYLLDRILNDCLGQVALASKGTQHRFTVAGSAPGCSVGAFMWELSRHSLRRNNSRENVSKLSTAVSRLTTVSPG